MTKFPLNTRYGHVAVHIPDGNGIDDEEIENYEPDFSSVPEVILIGAGQEEEDSSAAEACVSFHFLFFIFLKRKTLRNCAGNLFRADRQPLWFAVAVLFGRRRLLPLEAGGSGRGQIERPSCGVRRIRHESKV